MAYFWYFLGYGFLGYLLEKLFAALTHAEHRVRKGFLLAPVCPVYGLAMCAVLALGADRLGTSRIIKLALQEKVEEGTY